MTADMLPELQVRRQLPRARDRSDHEESLPGRRWTRGLLVGGAIAVVAVGATILSGLKPSYDTGPRLTHTLARGDLRVTVIEQGMLESSENTEIKCKVRGQSTVIWVVEGGTVVQPEDELVRLDTLVIEDAISERSKYAHWSRSSAERSAADVARAELAVSEYLEGRYRSQLMTLEKDLAIAESNLLTAKNMLDHAEMMAERGYISELDVDDRSFAVTQAELNVKVKKTEIDVLKRFAKSMELETLKGALNAAKARHAANLERAKMDAARRDLALEELQYCIVKAPRAGLVIYPSAAQWKDAPEIEVGTTVHKDQVLLLMPDLTKMQVKVGIHESVVDKIRPGMIAKVTLPDMTLEGKVSSVAAVTRPAGWWTGNVVKYDTIVELPVVEGLRPGMSAEVEIIIDTHENVLMIPVAAVVETEKGDLCWIKTAKGLQRRSLQLGDTDNSFVVVHAGVQEGNEVVLNPLACVQEAQAETLRPIDEANSRERKSNESESRAKPREAGSDQPAGDSLEPEASASETPP